METPQPQPRKARLKRPLLRIIIGIAIVISVAGAYGFHKLTQLARCHGMGANYAVSWGVLANQVDAVKRGNMNNICDSTCQTAIDNFMWMQQGDGNYKSPDCSGLPVGEPSDYRDPFNRDEKAYAFGYPTGHDGKIYLSWDAPDTGIDDPMNCRVALEFNLESHPECGWSGPVRYVIGPE